MDFDDLIEENDKNVMNNKQFKSKKNDKPHIDHVSPESLVNFRIILLYLVIFFYESICGDNK